MNDWQLINERSIAIAESETKIAALLNLRYKGNEKIFEQIKKHLDDISANNNIIWQISEYNKE